MNIYESLASALIVEHGAGTFCSSGWGGGANNRLGRQLWAWGFTAFGEGLYQLPQRYRLPLGTSSAYSYPHMNIEDLLTLGLPPETVFTMSPDSLSHWDNSVIHFATALLRYGGYAGRTVALRLLDPAFLVKAYSNSASRSITDFTKTPSLLNPHTPADFGLEPLSPGMDPGSPQVPKDFKYVDSVGCGAWFTDRYLHLALTTSAAPNSWFTTARTLAVYNKNLWTPFIENGAQKLLRHLGVDTQYEKAAVYLRCVDPAARRRWLSQRTGAPVLLWSTLPDATPAEMARGLKVIARTDSSPVRESLRYLGRDLTIEDFSELTPLQALRILYYSPHERIKAVCQSHTTELSAKFFGLTQEMNMVTECMVPHNTRKESKDLSKTSVAEASTTKWNEWASNIATQHVYAEEWRKQLLEICEPAVAFLALALHFGRQHATIVPVEAISAVLQSYPQIDAVLEVVRICPSGAARILRESK